MTRIAKSQLTRWLHRDRHSRQDGFTLLELLVAVIIGSLVVSGLLFIVIELLQISQREERLTETQQTTRRAIDYITSDLSEAVYVYSDPTTVTARLSDLPAGAEPRLAFWRLDPINVADVPADCSGQGAKEDECNALKVRQNVYTLVVYLLDGNDPNSVWEGPARVIRYELTKYKNITTLEQNPGYADPTLSVDNVPNSFENWINGANADGSPKAVDTEGNSDILTDHIHLTAGDSDLVTCPDTTNYVRTPADTTGNGFNSFYACIRTGNQSLNKSVIVYLQGNASPLAATDQVIGVSEASSLPRLESEVLIRGVIEKLPAGDDDS